MYQTETGLGKLDQHGRSVGEKSSVIIYTSRKLSACTEKALNQDWDFGLLYLQIHSVFKHLSPAVGSKKIGSKTSTAAFWAYIWYSPVTGKL